MLSSLNTMYNFTWDWKITSCYQKRLVKRVLVNKLFATVPSILVQKLWNLTFLFFSHDFTADIIADHWKVDFEKNSLKSWDLGRVWVYNINSKVTLLHENTVLLSNPLRNLGSIEDSEICDNLKSTLGPYFEIFWLCSTLITQNEVFWQLVPFDMLSHIFHADTQTLPVSSETSKESLFVDHVCIQQFTQLWTKNIQSKDHTVQQ